MICSRSFFVQKFGDQLLLGKLLHVIIGCSDTKKAIESTGRVRWWSDREGHHVAVDSGLVGRCLIRLAGRRGGLIVDLIEPLGQSLRIGDGQRGVSHEWSRVLT